MKVFSIIIIFSIQVFCQGEFLEKGESGVGAAYSYSSNNISSISGFNAAVTILGMVEFAVQHASGDVEDERSNKLLETSGTIFSLSYIVKRRNNNFYLKFLLGYYTGKVTGSSSSSSSSEALIAGIGFYPRFLKGYKFELRFGLELLYSFHPTEVSFDITSSIALGLSYMTHPVDNFRLIISPFASKGIDNSSGSISLGVSGGILISFETAN